MIWFTFLKGFSGSYIDYKATQWKQGNGLETVTLSR